MQQEEEVVISAASVNCSPLMETIMKRIRTQKKRLGRIEKYELLDKAKLNADQVEIISRKAEVLGTVKELEGVLEQVVLFEKEAVISAERTEVEMNQQKTLAIANAIQEEKKCQTDLLKFIQKITFTFGLPLSNLIGGHSVTEEEFNVLNQLKTKLTAPILSTTAGSTNINHNPTLGMEAFIEFSTLNIQKLFLNLEDELFPGTPFTFAGINELVTRLLSPQPEPKFGMFQTVNDASTPASSLGYTNMSINNSNASASSSNSGGGVHMPSFPTAINFLSRSIAAIEIEEVATPNIPESVDVAPVAAADLPVSESIEAQELETPIGEEMANKKPIIAKLLKRKQVNNKELLGGEEVAVLSSASVAPSSSSQQQPPVAVVAAAAEGTSSTNVEGTSSSGKGGRSTRRRKFKNSKKDSDAMAVAV